MNTKEHSARHDLESIFYVLIYMTTVYKGPESIRQNKDYDAFSSIPVLEWFEMRHTFRQMARLRLGHLCDFDNAILHKMDDYFQPLFPFFKNLLRAFFPDCLCSDNYDNGMTYEDMTKLFNDEYNRLKELERLEREKKGLGSRT